MSGPALELGTTDAELIDWAVIDKERRLVEFLIPAETNNQWLRQQQARLT